MSTENSKGERVTASRKNSAKYGISILIHVKRGPLKPGSPGKQLGAVKVREMQSEDQVVKSVIELVKM